MGFLSIGAILSFITGLAGPMASIINKISDLKIMKVKAETDKEKAQINQQIEEAHDKKAVIVAEAGTRVGSFVIGILQVASALPMISLLWFYTYTKIGAGLNGCSAKAIKPLQEVYCQTHFRMDPLDPNIWWIILTIIAFLFMGNINKIWKK